MRPSFRLTSAVVVVTLIALAAPNALAAGSSSTPKKDEAPDSPEEKALALYNEGLGYNDKARKMEAKLSATEMQGRVADTCLQLHGGYGYMREYGVSRAFVDARVQRIYGGTSEIMKELISRSVLA